MTVPFLDLKSHHRPLRAEIDAAISEVVDAGAFAGGPFVARFEEDFAAFCGTRFAVGVSSGTDALWLSLLALGVGPGDEVITVPNTFIATVEAISFCGATPVFVDVDEQTYTMDPRGLEQAISPRTRAVIPVHLYGQTADMDPILEIAQHHGLPVVEDAAQAHGALYRSRPAGSLGRLGCFSFYPGKNLGALGEAGAVVTNDAGLRDRVRMLRDHGQSRKYDHDLIGWNARMDGIQGAVLRLKLRHLADWNARRRTNAHIYDEALGGLENLLTPAEADWARHVYHLYVIRVNRRDELLRALADRGIACGIHYPTPVHLQAAYQHLRCEPGSFPVAERCARQALSLPLFPELTAEQVETVVNGLKGCLSEFRLKHEPVAAK
jgi:dTDP-4-amino-4,6-dideoxygalactose transaminase